MADKFMDAMMFRHAAKDFDSSKKISQDDLNYILEAGRLSPSSFGLEQWKFLVVQNQDLKDSLVGACFNQKQVASCSDLIVVLSKRSAFEKGSSYAKDVFSSRMPEEVVKVVNGFYENFSNSKSDEEKDVWAKKQCYIAGANMMTAGAFIGVDSCPMEGFDEASVLEILGLDSKEFGVALVIPFGFRSNEPRAKTRLDFDDVVEFRK